VTAANEMTQSNFSQEDLQILNDILGAFGKLEASRQERMLNTVATFLGLAPHVDNRRSSNGGMTSTVTERNQESLFSEDRSISPKQFMFEKQPKTDVEKVACLSYYLTHYRGTPHFKTLDISKLNTEAAQVKFANAAVAVENATKRNYLAPATKGMKQLTALGEQYVLALPDREKARNIMENARPRRRIKRATPQRNRDEE
jgi:hypothetical protein